MYYPILENFQEGSVPEPHELRRQQLSNLRELAKEGTQIGATVVIMRAEHGEGYFGKDSSLTIFRGFGIRMVTLKSLLIKPSHLYIQENQEFPTGGFFMVARENSDFEYSADCPWLSDLKTDVLHVSNTLPNSSNTTLFICPSGGWDNFDQQQIFDSLKVGVDLLSAAYKLKDEERNPIPLEGKKLDEFLGMCAFVLKRDFELHGLITPRISNKY